MAARLCCRSFFFLFICNSVRLVTFKFTVVLMTEICSSINSVRIRVNVCSINSNTDFNFVEIRRSGLKLFKFVVKVCQFSCYESVTLIGKCSVTVCSIVNSVRLYVQIVRLNSYPKLPK